MSDPLIGPFATSLHYIRQTFKQSSLNTVRGILTDHLIEQACRDAGHRWRACLLEPVPTVLSMIAGALWPEESWQAAASVLWAALRAQHTDILHACPTSGALSKARAKLPPEAWDILFECIAQIALAIDPQVDLWHGHRLLLVDGTTLSLEDTPELHRLFGTSTSGRAPGRYPLSRLVTLACARSAIVAHYAAGAYTDSECALLDSLLDELHPGDLLVGDRIYAAAHRYAGLRRRGLEFVIRKHSARKIERLEVLERFGPGDMLVRMPIEASKRRRDPSLPRYVVVRAIRRTVEGRHGPTDLWLITSLLDPQQYPAGEIVALYGGRWCIETLLGQFKGPVSANRLRSRSPKGVRKETAARLLALNLVNAIRLEAAVHTGADVQRISFVDTVRAIVAFAPAMAMAPVWKLPKIYVAMLSFIAERLVTERPGRKEPRMVRHEPKHYPSLKMTRQKWRETFCA